MTMISAARRDAIREALPALRLGEVLGGGAGGWVIAAYDESDGAPVAVKVLADERLRAPHARERLRTEAGVLINCRHPNLIEGIAFYELDEMVLLVMERVGSTTVLQRQVEVGVTVQDACGIALAAARALHCVHDFGLLHGDVKPDNVLFDPSGRHRLADFGLARRWPFSRERHIVGTPEYLAPEGIVNGGVLVPATDVYALGVTTYELLAGQSPYLSADGWRGVMKLHVHAAAIPLLAVAPHLPPPLASLVMAAIEREVDDRIQSAAEFADRLAAITEPAGVLPRGDSVTGRRAGGPAGPTA